MYIDILSGKVQFFILVKLIFRLKLPFTSVSNLEKKLG